MTLDSPTTTRRINVNDSETITYDTKPTQEYILYKYRFVIMFVFILAANMNGLMFGIFLPLQTTLRDAYDQSITWVSFCTLLNSNITYVPANFVANYIIDTYGLRAGTITGGLFTVLGLWARVLAENNFNWILIGQILAGFGTPYFYSTPQKVSNVWFGAKERTIITTFIVASFVVADSVGAIVPQHFVDFHGDPATVRHQLNRLFMVLSIIGTVSLVFVILLMRTKPKTPPSPAAAAPKYDYKKSMKALFKDKNTILLLASTSVMYSSSSTYIGTIQQLVAPLNIDGDKVGYILSVAILCGMIGSAIGATVLHKTRKFNTIVRALGVMTLLILIVNFFVALLGSAVLLGIAVLAFRIIVNPMVPISLEYAIELSFPIAESTVGGLWFVFNQSFALVESLGVDQIIERNNTRSGAEVAFYLMIGVQLIAMIPLIFIKEDLKRTRYEKEGLLNGDHEAAAAKSLKIEDQDKIDTDARD